MCGRYYVNDDTAREIEKLVRQVEEKLRKTASSYRTEQKSRLEIKAKDIHPTDLAPILVSSVTGLECRWQRWGFPGFQKKGQVIFNARCESALEKPLFREGILHRRAVIPAAGFYEWNREKKKYTFYREGHPAVFLAGCYRKYEDGDRFVILTTQANASMEPVHDRMPLVLESGEAVDWILEEAKAGEILRKTPPLLERRTEYEQMSLFDS
ncbi:MAG: SOS response-associated peptidase [Lachnospiraceae bacterium]|nr:SOS response-associated peptidase [Lachnospiraceae bacterium]